MKLDQYSFVILCMISKTYIYELGLDIHISHASLAAIGGFQEIFSTRKRCGQTTHFCYPYFYELINF